MTEKALKGKIDEVSQIKELEYIQKIHNLREERLIKQGCLYFIGPSIVLGLLGCFFPLVYIILPIHETDTCLCSFYNRGPVWKIEEPPEFFLSESNFCRYKLVSLISFLAFNWVFLVILLFKIYRIRHIHDKTLIKREIVTIIGVLIPFSIIQYILFLKGQHFIKDFPDSY